MWLMKFGSQEKITLPVVVVIIFNIIMLFCDLFRVTSVIEQQAKV